MAPLAFTNNPVAISHSCPGAGQVLSHHDGVIFAPVWVFIEPCMVLVDYTPMIKNDHSIISHFWALNLNKKVSFSFPFIVFNYFSFPFIVFVCLCLYLMSVSCFLFSVKLFCTLFS